MQYTFEKRSVQCVAQVLSYFKFKSFHREIKRQTCHKGKLLCHFTLCIVYYSNSSLSNNFKEVDTFSYFQLQTKCVHIYQIIYRSYQMLCKYVKSSTFNVIHFDKINKRGTTFYKLILRQTGSITLGQCNCIFRDFSAWD